MALSKPTRPALVAVWVATTVVVLGLVVLARLAMTGGDDPDTARQRPGILDLGDLPRPAPSLFGVDPGRPVTVFWAGRGLAPALCGVLAADPALVAPSQAVVLTDAPLDSCAPGVITRTVDLRATADAFGIPRSIDDGPPVGYSIVDSRGLIRYATLDPEIDRQIGEVRTMLNGLS